MDSIVRTAVWVALFGGTGLILLIELPRIVIWCLEIVEKIQSVRFHKKLLMKHKETEEPVTHSSKPPPSQ